MTIAGCYVSSEGVVLGADSTATFGDHYFNHAQKLFEVGEDSTIGIVMWGMGGVGNKSHRSLIGNLAKEVQSKAPAFANLQQVADVWSQSFWQDYTTEVATEIAECKRLDGLTPFGGVPAPGAAAAPVTRTEKEELYYQNLKSNLVVGFCIGGYVPSRPVPEAFEIVFDPLATKAPTPAAIPMWAPKFWGVPTITMRMILGFDSRLVPEFMNSPHWRGSQAELIALLRKHALVLQRLPIRDAVDFIHANISSTIKALKFSNYAQVCGGPIETAVITTDRKFRWVTHKSWDSAISEGDQ